MKIKIENIGFVKIADVEINGITVIAGENNTGKVQLENLFIRYSIHFMMLNIKSKKNELKALKEFLITISDIQVISFKTLLLTLKRSLKN